MTDRTLHDPLLTFGVRLAILCAVALIFATYVIPLFADLSVLIP